MKPTNLNPPTWGPFRPYQPLGLIAPTPNSCCGLNWKTGAGELGPNLAMDMTGNQQNGSLKCPLLFLLTFPNTPIYKGFSWKHAHLPAWCVDFAEKSSHYAHLPNWNCSSKISPRAVREALSSLPKSNFSMASWQTFLTASWRLVKPWPLVRNFCLVECLCWPVFFCRYCTYLESKSISLLQQGWSFFAYICDLSHK